MARLSGAVAAPLLGTIGLAGDVANVLVLRGRFMNCCFCRRRGRGERLPRGWKVSGNGVLCGQCRRQRYRLRSIRMAVVEPIEATLQELHAALDESWIHATPRDGVWEARIKEGQPVVRVLIRDRWWELRLKSADWSCGQRTAYEKIESGAAAGELFIYRAPTNDTQLRNRSNGHPNAQYEIMCRMVAWLPREHVDDAKGPQGAPPERASRVDRSAHLEETDIGDLREAIRANRVSFPSQVPTFPKHERPDLQRKLVQLYFVLGWNCDTIGARYGLVPSRVRQILNTWKRRAVKTGYIQHIPPVEVMSSWPW
jgi:hypothetical protein